MIFFYIMFLIPNIGERCQSDIYTHISIIYLQHMIKNKRNRQPTLHKTQQRKEEKRQIDKQTINSPQTQTQHRNKERVTQTP